jgi:hypothetical protein
MPTHFYIYNIYHKGSRDRSVGIRRAKGWTDEVRFPAGPIFLSSPKRPDRLRHWGPPSLMSDASSGRFPRGESGRVVKLITHLSLYPHSRTNFSLSCLRQSLRSSASDEGRFSVSVRVSQSYFTTGGLPPISSRQAPWELRQE